ncbi:30S ribosomal protein THX [Solirubrum puertoriconensis]|nr:30S ribosomal protein THX [Solirubrum puertoriconensis]
MGKGDKKSKRGKLTKGSFGKKRPHKTRNKIASTPKAAEAK